eukprot:3487352-Pyramimonas_sp.AAC.1
MFLLPRHHRDFQMWDSACRKAPDTDSVAPKKNDKDKVKKELKYEPDHLEAFQEADLHWPPQYSTDRELEDALQGLPERQRQCIWFREKTMNDKHRDVTTERSLDINLSMHWQDEARGKAQ